MNQPAPPQKRFCRTAVSRLLALVAACALVLAFPPASFAAVGYMPDVTAQMSKATYWSAKESQPAALLADAEEIASVNESIVTGKDTNVQDLSQWSKLTFDGVAQAESLVNSATADAEYYYSPAMWGRYAPDGTYMSTWEEALTRLYGPMIDNCRDPHATAEMPVQFAVCTTRTCLLTFPTDQPILDAENRSDTDFDLLYLSSIRVNEPMVLQAKSADGKYYQATTSCASGWVAADDIAICKDKDEWLSAWHISPDNTLVVYDDRVYTEDSNTFPQTANRKLPMGTCLELAAEKDWTARITNRSAHNNHVVWMPVRNDDGSYSKQLALIGENRKVSEGFLPLTAENIAMVAFNQLGDVYGWGGMLSSNDCSGYVRDVYKCFGLELARNTTWQAAQPVKKWDLSSMESSEKAELIGKLPLGSVLIFNGHEMLYLGKENDKFYVISSVSRVVLDGATTRIRNTVVNTLDIKRTNGNTWLEDMTCAEIPYYAGDAVALFETSMSNIASQTYTGKAIEPKVSVKKADGSPLVSGIDYIVKYENNTNAGTAKATLRGIQGSGCFGSVEQRFQILPAKLGGASASNIAARVYTGKSLLQNPVVKLNGRTLVKGSDYAISYKNNKNVGKASLVIQGKGNYTGTLTKNFNIKPKGTSIKKLKKGKKAFTATWKKQARQTTGYQIRYSTTSRFKNAKTLTVKGSKKTSKKVSKLKAKKTYYVKIRTYKLVNGKKWYSTWSKVRKVKTL